MSEITIGDTNPVYNVVVHQQLQEQRIQALEGQLAASIKPAWELNADKLITAGLAYRHLGIPYKFGAEYENDKAFDCSSFIQKIFGFVGVKLPRTSLQQSSVGTPVDFTDLRKGDIITFKLTSRSANVDHVGVYIGDSQFLHTNNTTLNINIKPVSEYEDRIVAIRRVL